MIDFFGTIESEAGTLVRLPSPLRGRAGERGKPRAPTEVIRRRAINELCYTLDEDASIVVAMRPAIEQAAPLSLTLPKEGGNPPAGASLTEVAYAVARIESGLSQ
jgi:hypothetical protein